jgi:hypothetical protein
MNKHDLKKRPEVGFVDMKNFEFGGLEVEELLSNGYLLYIPYGIHNDIFRTMQVGQILMHNRIDELNKLIEDTEDIPENVKKALVENFKNQIEHLRKHIEIIDKILPIQNEI